VRSGSPTSQYRVGIGVPSPSSGALRMTTGEPSGWRTTTSKGPRAGRPSSASTAARSVASSTSAPAAAEQLPEEPGHGHQGQDRTDALGDRRAHRAEEVDGLRLRAVDLAGGRWGPGGRGLVGAIGVGVLVVAAVLIYRGINKSFLSDLDLSEADARAARVATRLGQIGFPALGFAFATIGVLLLIAAFRNDSQQQVGLDAGLKTLAGQPYGPYLLLLLAAGVACYGVYCLFDARFRKA